MSYRTHIRLTAGELGRLSNVRGRAREATYCQDATIWVAELGAQYLGQCAEHNSEENCVNELRRQLRKALASFRPAQGLRSRKAAKRKGVEFKDDELAKIDQARGGGKDSDSGERGEDSGSEAEVAPIDRTTFVYLATLMRIVYDEKQHQSQPSLTKLIRLLTDEI